MYWLVGSECLFKYADGFMFVLLHDILTCHVFIAILLHEIYFHNQAVVQLLYIVVYRQVTKLIQTQL